MPDINVEVVFATPESQRLCAIAVKDGTTVREAIAASGLESVFTAFDFDSAAIGVWGHEVTGDHVLRDGDRVEIYRPLELDPREARRQLALSGKTMSGGERD